MNNASVTSHKPFPMPFTTNQWLPINFAACDFTNYKNSQILLILRILVILSPFLLFWFFTMWIPILVILVDFSSWGSPTQLSPGTSSPMPVAPAVARSHPPNEASDVQLDSICQGNVRNMSNNGSIQWYSSCVSYWLTAVICHQTCTYFSNQSPISSWLLIMLIKPLWLYIHIYIVNPRYR